MIEFANILLKAMILDWPNLLAVLVRSMKIGLFTVFSELFGFANSIPNVLEYYLSILRQIKGKFAFLFNVTFGEVL